MNIFLRMSALVLSILSYTGSYGQEAAHVDSIKRTLAQAKTIQEKVYLLDNLSRTLMNVNLQESDKYGQELITVAEESRDRSLMVKAYMSNGERCGYFGGRKDFVGRSIQYYNKALEIAKQNKLDDDRGGILLRLASVHLSIPEKDKSLQYASQAYSIISTLKNDSLHSQANAVYGDVYLARNEKILALRHYFTGLRIAEETGNASLKRICYLKLSTFYSNIGDYDRAIDYFMNAHKELDHMKEKNVPYARTIDMTTLANLYSYKKNYDMAINYYERSLIMADSLKFSTLKVPGYIGLLNQYLRMEQPQQALNFMNSAKGANLKIYLANFGFSGMIDQAYGLIYSELGMLDSAKNRFDRTVSFFEKTPNEVTKMGHYALLGDLYEKRGELKTAINYYLQVKEMAERTGQLESAGKAAKHLDSLYVKTGDFQMANKYNSIYYQYKDSSEKLNKEKELAQVEAADEQLRQERLLKEAEDKKRRRNNIQYLAITIGIAALFIALVLLGMFKVSATTIKMIGFFAFIMFFEFIFLIFKKNIYSITKGEPLLDLLFMIGLAALLLPLHHWLEEKAIHYLTSHNRLTAAGKHIKMKLFRRKAGE